MQALNEEPLFTRPPWRWLAITVVAGALAAAAFVPTQQATDGWPQTITYTSALGASVAPALVVGLATPAFVAHALGRRPRDLVLAAVAPFVVATVLYLLLAAALALATGAATLKLALAVVALPLALLTLQAAGAGALVTAASGQRVSGAVAFPALVLLELIVTFPRHPAVWLPLGHAALLGGDLGVGRPPTLLPLALHAAVGALLLAAGVVLARRRPQEAAP